MNANKLLFASMILAMLSGCAVYPSGSPYYYPGYVTSSANQAFNEARDKEWKRNKRKSSWQSKPFRPWKHQYSNKQKITPVSSSGRSHFWKSHHGSHYPKRKTRAIGKEGFEYGTYPYLCLGCDKP